MNEPAFTNQSIEKQEQPGLNLLSDYKKTVEAIMDIENNDQEWLDYSASTIDGYSIGGAIDFLEYEKETREELAELPKEEAESLLRHRDFVIYGSDGYNRYRVDLLGNISFISSLKRDEKSLQKAREHGFNII